MEGNPTDFEAIGSRLGLRVDQDDQDRLRLTWQGTRFPAFLCLGVALALLFLSIPILQAIRLKGFQGPASSLWYFPIMNLILLGIAVFLFSLKRTILLDCKAKHLIFRKRSLFRTARLYMNFDEVMSLKLGTDQVYSGFAVAGSSAAERYPVPSLRLALKSGETVLLDRGGLNRLRDLGQRLSGFLGRPLETEKAPYQHQPLA